LNTYLPKEKKGNLNNNTKKKIFYKILNVLNITPRINQDYLSSLDF